MADTNHNEVSRRNFLAALGLGAAAIAGGCGSQSHEPTAEIPNPFRGPGPVVPPSYSNPAVAGVPEIGIAGVIPRSVWARGGPDMSRIKAMNGVGLITFHHSGDPRPFFDNGYVETAQHLEYVREFHRSSHFQDIGYHFAIDRTGRVWQLRSVHYQGEHVRGRGNNEHNVGVVVLGNFDMQAMTQQQQQKVIQFGAALRRYYKLPISKVFTHQEIVSTECPGRAMQPFMVSIRRRNLI